MRWRRSQDGATAPAAVDPLATGPSGSASSRWTVVRQVGQFALLGLVAVAVVGLTTEVASRRIGQREAIVDARTTAIIKAQGLVEPVVTDTLPTGDPAAVAKVAEAVENGVLDPNLVRVKIWARDGTIVYSDEPRLIGARYALGADEVEAIDAGVVEAEVSDLTKPENQFERERGKLLEVYLPIRTPDGERLLFEAYFRYDAVNASGARIWRSFAPVSIGALIVLELVQIPLAWSLARQLRQRSRQREGLLRQTLETSDVERRRIASDLHDGVVQDLAGVAFSLGAAARTDGVPPDQAKLFEDSAVAVRDSIKALRSLLVEIYPPNLFDEGLDAALADLLGRASGRGVEAALDTSGLSAPLPPNVAGLLYRTAQEALRNVFAHARATTVRVTAATGDGLATLAVVDDGVGFDPAHAPDGVATGHFGLAGLRQLVGDAGGRVQVQSAVGTGTTVRVEVPLR